MVAYPWALYLVLDVYVSVVVVFRPSTSCSSPSFSFPFRRKHQIRFTRAAGGCRVCLTNSGCEQRALLCCRDRRGQEVRSGGGASRRRKRRRSACRCWSVWLLMLTMQPRYYSYRMLMRIVSNRNTQGTSADNFLPDFIF